MCDIDGQTGGDKTSSIELLCATNNQQLQPRTSGCEQFADC